MSTIITRASKGAPLSWTEADTNLTNLNTDKLEASSLTPYLTSATAASTYATIKSREIVSVLDFGAIGNGVADDTVAIQAAVNSLSGRGGIVCLVPTGYPYKISNTITLPNGCILVGSLAKNFAGATATNAQWASAGSWLYPTNPSNPAVRLQGHGSGISGVGFIHDQPTPGGSWAPNTYGFCIENIASHTSIENILIVNASHGIYFKYTAGSGGGTQVKMRDVIVSAFVERLRTTCINDTAYWSNVHMRNLYYSSNSLVSAYIRANTKGWRCGYTDNIMVDGIEFFEDAVAIYYEDETCLGNTHSLYNATLSNVQFNLPQVCMKVAATTTKATASFSNVISQTGNAFGYTYADTAFQLNSDNIDLKFNGLTIRDAGGQVFALGNGTGSKLTIDNLSIDKYASVSLSQVCFGLSANSFLNLSNYKITKTAGVGARFSGAGLENISTDCYGQVSQFGRFGEQVLAGNGAFQDFSTDSYLRFGQMRVHQARLVGQLNITTAVDATTAAIKMAGGITELSITGINTATTGYQAFDSGWTDIADANLSSLATLGRLQVQAAAGVNLYNGSINILYR